MSDTLMATLYTFCNDWHGGQWTRLYRLSCRLQKRIQRLHDPVDCSDWAIENLDNDLYRQLEEEYGS